MPAAANNDLDARVSALTTSFKGSVMLYAKNLRTGRDFGRGAETKVRTASTIKLDLQQPAICTALTDRSTHHFAPFVLVSFLPQAESSPVRSTSETSRVYPFSR